MTDLLKNSLFLSLLFSFICVSLIEYLKFLLQKNVSKEVMFEIKDHVLPFVPILFAILASFVIKPIESMQNNIIFNIFYYISCIYLIYKVFYKTIIDKIKNIISNYSRKK